MSSNATAATARRITAAAQAAVRGSKWTTSSQGPYSYRVALRTVTAPTGDLLAGSLAGGAIVALDGMTATWGRDRSGTVVINVTDETARDAEVRAMEAARAEVVATRRGPSPEAVSAAVAKLQAQLTAAAPALGRALEELDAEDAEKALEESSRRIAAAVEALSVLTDDELTAVLGDLYDPAVVVDRTGALVRL